MVLKVQNLLPYTRATSYTREHGFTHVFKHVYTPISFDLCFKIVEFGRIRACAPGNVDTEANCTIVKLCFLKTMS